MTKRGTPRRNTKSVTPFIPKAARPQRKTPTYTLRQILQSGMANKWVAEKTPTGYQLEKEGRTVDLRLSFDDEGKATVEDVRVDGTRVHANKTRRAMEVVGGSWLR